MKNEQEEKDIILKTTSMMEQDETDKSGRLDRGKGELQLAFHRLSWYKCRLLLFTFIF